MTILATHSDIETFIFERSPHVTKVEVIESDESNIVAIIITVKFWYRFFYEKTFYSFITNLIKENQMYGVEYDIIINS